MKQLFLLCNAHIDPVWQWQWEEGAAATIATFRTAADFCREYDGFVFCHNEAMLYQWIEEYEPTLFKEIQNLVKEGKWKIMGGWYLQPDCNLPSGESILRQILVGRKYFSEKFGVEPSSAVSFDAFGHDRGMVQIMTQCGFSSYLIKRPEKHLLSLPARNFYWQGFDGSKILTRRLDREYKTLKGRAVQDARQWVEKEAGEEISLFTWGIGNHGGGPSREDWVELRKWMETRPDISFVNGTAEDFFGAIEGREELPVYENDLRPVFVGCYTSQAKVKQLHNQLEDMLFATEKLLTAAAAQGLCHYPARELAEAQNALLVSQFHDTLPGTTIASVEDATLHTLGHGMEILTRLRNRGFMAMLSGQKKAEPGEIPLFFYNPHPYPVTGDFCCEFMLEDQNWSSAFHNTATVLCDGEALPTQEEKEESNITLDWRKRVVFRGTLQPSGITRFACQLHQEPVKQKIAPVCTEAPICIKTDHVYVQISTVTGLVDRYEVDGREYLCENALGTVIFEDTPDPWYMSSDRYGPECGRFKLMTATETAEYLGAEETEIPAVRIIEDGDVRTVVEAIFRWKNSVLIQTYRVSKFDAELELEQTLHWNEHDKIAKLEIPSTITGGRYLGQGMFGTAELAQDGSECVSHQWCGKIDDTKALAVIKFGCYGSHCKEGMMYLSLLRSPAYCAHPIDGRPLIDRYRYLRRMDQSVHRLRFVLCGGGAQDTMANIDRKAQLRHEAPFGLNAFPSGIGKMINPFVVLSNPDILISALYWEEAQEKIIMRLWNPLNRKTETEVIISSMAVCAEVSLAPFRFGTYCIDESAGIREVDPVTLQPKSTAEISI